jgi:hypothetical protein
MQLIKRVKSDRRMEERLRVIVDLSRWRDRILEVHEMDLEALAILAADYVAANLPCAAADLRRRLEWYRISLGKLLGSPLPNPDEPEEKRERGKVAQKGGARRHPTQVMAGLARRLPRLEKGDEPIAVSQVATFPRSYFSMNEPVPS